MRGLLRFVFLSLAPALAWAQVGGPTVGPEFQVNTHTTSYQIGGSVAGNAVGGFIVTWASQYPSDSQLEPRAQHFDALGVPIGSETPLHANAVVAMLGLEVAMNGNGEFVVSWEAAGSGGGQQYDVFVRSFDATGVPDGDEFVAHTSTSGLQGDPTVAIAPDGSFVAAWAHFGNPDNLRDVQIRRFDSEGQPIDSESLVNEFTTGNQRFPELATDAAGNFVVVWAGTGDQDGSGYGIFARRYDAQAVPFGSEFQVNTYTTGEQNHPDVGMNAAGEFVVTWWSEDQDGSEAGVFAQRFDASGAMQGSEFQANSYTTDWQQFPQVASADSGGFVIVWHSGLEHTGNADLFAQQYDTEGNPVAGEFRVNSHTENRQTGGWISTAVNGDFVVAWTDWSGQDGDASGIFAQRFVPTDIIFIDSFESGNTSAWSDSVP